MLDEYKNYAIVHVLAPPFVSLQLISYTIQSFNEYKGFEYPFVQRIKESSATYVKYMT